MSKKILKIILINLFILLLLLIFIETTSYIGRIILGKPSVGWLYFDSGFKELKEPCKKFRTHPFYTITHDHNNKCDIKEGYATGPFVHYNQNYKDSKVLITLGGSTTDGFFQDFSKGETWPLQLNRLLKHKNIKI